jgi:serine/threonine protein kinase
VLSVMHARGLAHLDVKPDNILQSRDQPDVYKLADFGLTTRRDMAWPVEEGDKRYLAAELLAGDHRNLQAADIFSLGLTLYELATGAELPGDGELYQRLRRGGRLQLPGLTDAFANQLQVRSLPPTEFCRAFAGACCMVL